jgi:histidine triad (HIT) family protein
MDDCVFCNIINKTIEAKIEMEDGMVVVVRDILPKAPVHLLILPKEHIVSVNELTETHTTLVTKMVLTAKAMAEKFGIAQTGYKLIFNVGRDGGMVIPHLHLHLLGGKNLGE